jgi:hypothetical protein
MKYIYFSLFVLLIICPLCCIEDVSHAKYLNDSFVVSIYNLDNYSQTGDLPRGTSASRIFSTICDNDLYLIICPSYLLTVFNELLNSWEHISYAPIAARETDSILYFGSDNHNLFLVMDKGSGEYAYIMTYVIDESKWYRTNLANINATAAIMQGSAIYITLDNRGFYQYDTLAQSMEKKQEILFYFTADEYDKDGGYSCISEYYNMIISFYGSSMAQYLIDNDTWESIYPLPNNLFFHRAASSCICNGTDVFIYQNYENMSYIYSYNIAAKSWNTLYENDSITTQAWQYPYILYAGDKLYCLPGHDYSFETYIIVFDGVNGTYDITRNCFYDAYHIKFSRMEGVYHLIFKDKIFGIGGTPSYSP